MTIHSQSRIHPSGPLLLVLLLLALGCEGNPQEERGQGEATGAPPGAEVRVGHEEESAAGPLLDVRARPASMGMDSLLLAEAVQRASRQSRLHNMVVARHGEVVLERHFRGPGPAQPANVKSVSKSLLSALVGLAIRDGHLEGVDTPIGPFFPEYLSRSVQDGNGSSGSGEGGGPTGGTEQPAGASDPRWDITIAHLLSMSSGLQSTSFRNYGAWVASPDWVANALGRPMIFEPGGRMVYSTGNTHIVSALLSRAVGRSTHAYAREVLAEPLGIQLPPWPTDPQGIHFGGNDMLVSPRALVRFGELYRKGGLHEDERILPREWVEESWRIRVRSRRDGNGYGLGWWARHAGEHEVRFAWGYGGQFLFVVPALELTVVFTSDPWSARERGHNQVLHGLLDDYLVPAAVRGEGPP